MSSKRQHTKSRHGCVQCKKRRVKCCESVPMCTRCQVRGESCSLGKFWYRQNTVTSYAQRRALIETSDESERTTIEIESTTHSEHYTACSPYQSSSLQSQSLASFGEANMTDHSCQHTSPERAESIFTSRQATIPNMTDEGQSPVVSLEYIHHFLLHTAHSLVFLPSSIETWSETVPKLAYSNDFLLHQMIVLSALHKACLCELSSPKDTADSGEALRHLRVAEEHRARAMELFIPKLDQTSPDTCVALLSFNLLFIIVSFAGQVVAHRNWKRKSAVATSSKQAPDGEESELVQHATITDQLSISFLSGPEAMNMAGTPCLSNLLDSLSIIRGNDTIIQEYWPWIETFEIGNIFRIPDWQALDEIPSAAQQSLDWMRLQSREFPPQERLVVDKEIMCLYRMAKVAANPSKCVNQGFIVDYPANMSQRTVVGLKEQEPLSLVMLSFWVACFNIAMNQTCGRWWAKGWPQDLIGEIVNILSQKDRDLSMTDTVNESMNWGSAMKWPTESCAFS